MTKSHSPHRIGKWSDWQVVGLLAILVLAVGVRFYSLGDQSLWYDESDRVFIASLPLRDIFPTMAEEGLHYLPLYFLIQKPFVRPFNETVARFPSVCFGVLAVALMAQTGAELWSKKGGLAAALLLAVNPFHVWFSRDASFYALVALSSLGTLYFFLRWLAHPSLENWVGLTMFTGMGICTHYFAFVMPVVQLLYLILTFRRNHKVLRPWLLSQIVAFLPLVPWYAFLVRRGEFYFGSAALDPPRLVEIAYTFWNFSIGYTGILTPFVVLALIGFGCALVLGALSFLESRRDQGILLILWFAVPIAMTFLMALRLPMYVDRYLIPSLPAFLLIVVAGILKAGRRRDVLWLTVLIVVSALSAARIYYDPVYHKEDWRGVANHIEENEQPGDVILPLLYQSLTPLLGQYYRGELPLEPICIQSLRRDPEVLVQGHRRVWLIIPQHHNSTHWLARCQSFDTLDPANYRSSSEKAIRPWLENHLSDLAWHHDFTCVSLLLFDID